MDLSLKRIIGYLLDIVLVTLVATVISNIKIINPYHEKYMEVYEKYEEIVKNDDVKVDNEEIININYQIYKYKTISNSISIVCLLLYFGLFEYLADGETLGQKAMKIKIVHKDSKKRGRVWNYLIRIIILNNIIFTIIAMGLVFLLDANKFYYSSYVISLIQSAVLLVNIIMIIMRKDHRGLHDMLSNTIVVSNNIDVTEDKIEEVKPKKESIKDKADRKTRQKKKDMV